jgi:hypothetical protein
MFHLKLIELEAELMAKEQSQKGFARLPYECSTLLGFVEREIGVRLGDRVNRDWRGWLTYKRGADSLVILRGRAFNDGGRWQAGVDVPYGHDTITEYERHFDVTPPAEIDHLLVNFGQAPSLRVFLWFGEGIAEYKLIFMADMQDDPHNQLMQAIVEACGWILKRPKDKTFLEFAKEIGAL